MISSLSKIFHVSKTNILIFSDSDPNKIKIKINKGLRTKNSLSKEGDNFLEVN